MEDVKDESKNWKEDPALLAIHNANMAKKGLSLLNKLDNLEMWSRKRAIGLSLYALISRALLQANLQQ